MIGDDPLASAGAGAGGTAAERLHRLFEAAWAQRLDDAPEYATFFGVPGYGDRWSDLSPAAVAERRARAGAPLEALHSIDRSELDEADRLSWDVFEHQARSDAEAARFPNDHLLVVGPLGHPASEAAQTLAAMPTSTSGDLADVLERLRRLPALLDQACALLDEGLALGVTPPAVTLRDVPSSIAPTCPRRTTRAGARSSPACVTGWARPSTTTCWPRLRRSSLRTWTRRSSASSATSPRSTSRVPAAAPASGRSRRRRLVRGAGQDLHHHGPHAGRDPRARPSPRSTGSGGRWTR
jgi:hypothetical protein